MIVVFVHQYGSVSKIVARRCLKRPCSIYKLPLQFNAAQFAHYKVFFGALLIRTHVYTRPCVGLLTDRLVKPGMIDGA